MAVETIAGEAVSEQTPYWQEVTVTSVVFPFDSNLLNFIDSIAEIGHHVVYSVVIPLMVVVAVETIAGETVFEQLLDSQVVTVTKVVCWLVVDVTEVILYTVVRSRENPEEVLLMAPSVLEDEGDAKGTRPALFSYELIPMVELVVSFWLLSSVESAAAVEIGDNGVANWEDICTEVEVGVSSWTLEEEVLAGPIWALEDSVPELLDGVRDGRYDSEDSEGLNLVKEEIDDGWSSGLTVEEVWILCSLDDTKLLDVKWALGKETLEVKLTDVVDELIVESANGVVGLVIKLVGDEGILVTFVLAVENWVSEIVVESGMVTELEDSDDLEIINVEVTELVVTVWLPGYMGVMLCTDGVK